MNSFSFCLSEDFFISPSILNDNLAEYRVLGCGSPTPRPFQYFSISCHSLMACRFSAEKSIFSHRESSLLYDFVSLLLPYEFSLFFLILTFNYDMFCCASAWFHLIWDHLRFLCLDICFLLQAWEVFSHNLINIFSTPFFLSPPPRIL